MTRINLSENGNTPFEKLIGHNPQILEKWNELESVFWNNISLDHNLLEQVRRAMAFENGCEYCMVKGGKPDFDKTEFRISVAVAFAELFCKHHHGISISHFDVLKECFTIAEISELCTFIAFINSSQKLGRVFNLTEEFQLNAVIKLNELEK